MSRHGPDTDRITVARLSGTATRHAQGRDTDEQVAAEELRAMATEHRRGLGPRLRVDLLSEAAGSLVGSHRHSPSAYWSAPKAARLLLAAGADVEQARLHAEETTASLRGQRGLGGIGNPV